MPPRELITSQAMGRAPSACSRIFAASSRKHQLQRGGDAQARGGLQLGQPARRGGRRSSSASPRTRREERAVQREALLQSADLYAKAGNTPKAIAMLEKFVAANPDAAGRCGGSAAAPRRLRQQERRRGAARPLVPGDHQAPMRRRAPQRTERTHYLAAKAQLALAQPARDAFRARAPERAAEEEPGRASATRSRRRWTATSAPPITRSRK